MNTPTILQTLSLKSPPSTTGILLKPPITSSNLRTNRNNSQLIRFRPVNSTSGSNSKTGDGNDTPPAITPPETVQVRFRRGSRKRRQLRENGGSDGKRVSSEMKATSSNTTPKKWEEMSATEKVIELYMGEKGLLFWLNKFAYASIFIVIGAWILFRFVGPSLNLYQLDSTPLPPSSLFKGS